MACASDTIWPAAAPRRRRPPRPEMLLSSHLEGEEGGKKDAVVVFPFEKVFPVYAMGRLPGPDTPPSVSLPGDPIWEAISREAKSEAEKEPILSSFLYASIVAHDCLEQALAFVLANRLQNPTLLATQLLDIFSPVISNDPGIRCSIRLDAQAFKDRDPACLSYCSAVLYLKVHFSAGWCPFASPFDCINGAFFFSRATTPCNPTEWLMCCGTKEGECWHWHCRVGSARWFHQAFGVDIHPAAKIGEGILLDHGTGVVIGETAVVGNRVSLLHGVTLGGTGKEIGDRHPKVGDGALIGACATILGNIRIGEGAMIASGSLVLKDVPPHSMVAGTPSKVIGYMDEKDPSLTMNHDATKEFFKHVAASFKEDRPAVNDNHRVDVEMCPAAPRCTDNNGHA